MLNQKQGKKNRENKEEYEVMIKLTYLDAGHKDNACSKFLDHCNWALNCLKEKKFLRSCTIHGINQENNSLCNIHFQIIDFSCRKGINHTCDFLEDLIRQTYEVLIDKTVINKKKKLTF
jgi:hypothetical protein